MTNLMTLCCHQSKNIIHISFINERNELSKTNESPKLSESYLLVENLIIINFS